MTFSYNIIFFLISIMLLVIIYNQHDVIKHYKSNVEYYKWHNSIFDPPKSTSWYLVQTNDNEKKIKVLFYKARNGKWCKDRNEFFYEDNVNIEAWCHLPNYLYPKDSN